MNEAQADSILSHERELEEAREIKAQADRVKSEEQRKLRLAEQRKRETAEAEDALASFTKAMDAIKPLSHDTLYRCDASGLVAMLDRAILGAERRLALLDGDEARVKEIQRRRAELPADLANHPRNFS